MPGISAHPAEAARDGRPARPANNDAGHIIANNIITDFGYGDSHWIWPVPQDNCNPLRFNSGHERRRHRQSRVRHRRGWRADQRGAAQLPPRYRWTVFVSRAINGPVGLKFSNNIFHPGTEGVSNVPLE